MWHRCRVPGLAAVGDPEAPASQRTLLPFCHLAMTRRAFLSLVIACAWLCTGLRAEGWWIDQHKQLGQYTALPASLAHCGSQFSFGLEEPDVREKDRY